MPRLHRHGSTDFHIGGIDALGGKSPGLRLAHAGGDEPADLHADRRLRGRLARNVRDRDGAAPQVERNLAVRRLRAARAQIGEGRIHFARDPPLDVEFEAEKAARRNHDGGDQPGKNFDHEDGSDCPASQITYCEAPLDGSVAMASTISDDLRAGALVYHRSPKPGKLEIQPTKPLGNQRDLALAYSPGVAAACEAIAADPAQAAELTARANLVAVVSNGTAVLGLGNIGPLAAKPVMEGKAVLFKKFAGIDVFDIEVDAHDVDTLVDVVAALEPTFGGINLEDIKAPECFEIEDAAARRA